MSDAKSRCAQVAALPRRAVCAPGWRTRYAAPVPVPDALLRVCSLRALAARAICCPKFPCPTRCCAFAGCGPSITSSRTRSEAASGRPTRWQDNLVLFPRCGSRIGGICALFAERAPAASLCLGAGSLAPCASQRLQRRAIQPRR
jgi:hypothetical protein